MNLVMMRLTPALASAVRSVVLGATLTLAGATLTSATRAAAQPVAPVAPVQPAAPRRVVVEGVDLTGVGYDVGSPTAPVVLVNFSDFGCPYCASFARETYPAIDQEFVRTGRVMFKYVPFALGTFLNGKQAARASECAAEQQRFWPMHAALYEQQRAWKNTIHAYPVFRAAALRLGLDEPAFARCYDTRRTDVRTERASILAKQLGVRVTPTFFVDGRRVEGALPLAQFRLVLGEAVRAKTP